MPGRRENTDELDPAGLEPIDLVTFKAQHKQRSPEPDAREPRTTVDLPAQAVPDAGQPVAANPNGAEPSPNGTDPDAVRPDVAGPGAADNPDVDHPDVDHPDVVPDHRDENLLIDAHEDRWHWRRRIRSNPHKLRVYRVVVAIGGLLLVSLGLLTGPLPGPGGIPLILLGIAIWSSEFEWAHRLMHVFKAQLRRFQSWTRLQQVGFWVAFFSFCGLCGYSFMLATGVPGWVPDPATSLLQRLPGL